jgi:molybdate transport system ATP-binding protein
MLLLDEPLAALDAGTRPAVRADLRHHLRSYRGCTVLVTHDPLEAMVLGDRIVVLEQGRGVQDGPPAELARHPRTGYVARLVGLNLLRGDAHGRIVTLGSQAAVAVAHDASGPVHVAFAPAAVTLSLDQPHGSARNAWSGRVSDVEQHGDLVRITVDGPVPLLADVTPLAVADLALGPGVEVWVGGHGGERSWLGDDDGMAKPRGARRSATGEPGRSARRHRGCGWRSRSCVAALNRRVRSTMAQRSTTRLYEYPS